MKRAAKILLTCGAVFAVPFIASSQTLQSYSYTNAATTSATIQANVNRNPVYLHFNCEDNPISISSVKVFGMGNGANAVYTRARIGQTYSDTVILPGYTSHRAATSTYTFSPAVDCPAGEVAIAFEGSNASATPSLAYYLGKAATSTTNGDGWCSAWDLGSGTYANNSSCQTLNNAWNYEIWGTEYVPSTGGGGTATDTSRIENIGIMVLWLIAFSLGMIYWERYLRS